MRATWMLAAAPLLVFGIVPSRHPVAFKPKPVPTEGVRAQRLDDQTFKVRWTPVAQLPPAMVEVLVVREEATPPATPTLAKRAALRSPTNICTRHGLRKVTTQRGRWSRWRCRR